MEARIAQRTQTEEAPTRRSVVRNEKKIAKQRAALRWWVGTVVLTLFPTLSTVLVTVLQGNTSITWDLVFGDGEIILASFLIVASTSITGYTAKNKTVFTDLVRYILFFLVAVQLIGYTIIKTNSNNNPTTVIVVSLAALFISVCMSWIWYLLSDEEV